MQDQGTAAADSDARSVDSMEIDVDAGADSDNFEPTPAPAKKAPPARGGARKTTAAPGKRAPAKGKKAVVSCVHHCLSFSAFNGWHAVGG